MGEAIGKCIQCRGPLILINDNEGRKWAKCTSCGAQYPLEQGRPIVDSKPDKVDDKSLP